MLENRNAMRVLAITSFRPDEIVRSVHEMTAPTEVISITPTSGRLGHILDTYEQTQNAIQSHDPDVILLDCYETMGIVVAHLARQHDIPLVARLVGDTWRRYENPSLLSVRSLAEFHQFGLHRAALTLDKLTFSQVDGFVTVSEELKHIVYSRAGTRPECIGVVPVPLTVDTLTEGSARVARQSLDVDETQMLLTVTNLKFSEKFEGVKTALAELQGLLCENPDLGYVIAGSGQFYDPLTTAIEEMVPDQHVRDRIYTPGYVEDVADLYALADVFVYVSYLDGYPNAVLEAQTAQLPVVANAAHGMCDQITDGETGYLVDPGQSGQLRDRVTSLLGSPDERRRIGEQARQRVFQENTSAVIGEQLEESLTTILENC